MSPGPTTTVRVRPDNASRIVTPGREASADGDESAVR